MTSTSCPFIPTTWGNQAVTLYHGTTDQHANSIIAKGIQIGIGRARTDFGRGFYTTTVQRQALSWAWYLTQTRRGTQPAVIRFDVDRERLAKLDCLWFVRGSFDADDFWSFVFHCRQGAKDHARKTSSGYTWYDVVVGPVAASWKQRLTIYDADQVSFHTPNAVALLNNSSPRRIP